MFPGPDRPELCLGSRVLPVNIDRRGAPWGKLVRGRQGVHTVTPTITHIGK